MDDDMLVLILKKLDYLMTMLADEKNRKGPKKMGRPTKGHIVREYRKFCPNATKTQCVRATGVTIKTVSKYWQQEEVEQ